MSTAPKLVQFIREPEMIQANLTDEGGQHDVSLHVFGWGLYSNGDLEPLFLDDRWQNGREPYGVDQIAQFAGAHLDIVKYLIIGQK